MPVSWLLSTSKAIRRGEEAQSPGMGPDRWLALTEISARLVRLASAGSVPVSEQPACRRDKRSGSQQLLWPSSSGRGSGLP